MHRKIGEVANNHLGSQYPFSKMGQLLANMNCAHNDNILRLFLNTDDCHFTSMDCLCTKKLDYEIYTPQKYCKYKYFSRKLLP